MFKNWAVLARLELMEIIPVPRTWILKSGGIIKAVFRLGLIQPRAELPNFSLNKFKLLKVMKNRRMVGPEGLEPPTKAL